MSGALGKCGHVAGTRSFEVTIEPMPAGLMRGWRRGVLGRSAPSERD